MNRRFTNAKLTRFGRIGHPGALERKLVRCIGVTFEDRHVGHKWTYRRYEAYRDQWPELDVWTVQVLMPVSLQRGNRGYGNQEKVEEAMVPAEVRAFALAELVKQRLQGKVFA